MISHGDVIMSIYQLVPLILGLHGVFYYQNYSDSWNSGGFTQTSAICTTQNCVVLLPFVNTSPVMNTQL